MPGGAALPAAVNTAAKSAEATRVARQAQAAQAAQSQMAAKPSSPQVSFEPRTPAVWRRPEGRTAGGFDPSKSTSAQSDMERAKQFFGLNNPDRELVQAYTKMRSSGQIPPKYTQPPSGQTPMAAATARQKRELAKKAIGPAMATGGAVGAAAGTYMALSPSSTDTKPPATPPSDAFQARTAPGQAAASKAAADELKKAPPKDRTQIDELGPLVIPALASLGAGGLAGTAAYQALKPSKPTSVQTSSAAARPAAATTPPAARPAAATTARPAGGPQQGVVGSELARLSGGEFASRADRLNQAKVNAILGSGYKAGTAAANLALRDYYRRSSQGTAGSSAAAPAAATGTPAAVSAPPAASPSSTGAAPSQSSPRPAVSSGSTEPAGSDSGGDSAGFERWVPPRDSSSGGTPVKSGTGQTWTDSSGQPIVTMPEEKNSLMRLLKLSGQKH